MTASSERIEVYLDDSPEPLLRRLPPALLELDTRTLDDGEHALRVEAWDGSGRKGVRIVPFRVRNGPAISITGLTAGDVVEGQLSLVLHAYAGGNEEHWKPELAEVPAPVPTWAWVIAIVVAAWAMFYAVSYWHSEPSISGSANAPFCDSGPTTRNGTAGCTGVLRVA